MWKIIHRSSNQQDAKTILKRTCTKQGQESSFLVFGLDYKAMIVKLYKLCLLGLLGQVCR
jgi:hypothetical protein